MRILTAVLTACLCVPAAQAQDISVKGKVTDSGNAPLVGVGVFIEGTATGTVTGADGTWSISDIPSDATLTFSSIGYVTQKVHVAGKSVIDVILQEDIIDDELGEVMVVAYGTAKKSSFTGSASVVKGDELQKRVTGNITKSIEGTVAGLQVTSGGGQPGEGASIMIRGIGSVNAVSTPLYVVDGIPYDGSLSAINPADIESLTVLKDASAGALYGARGANGVILITTRRGKEGRMSISVSSNTGVQQPISLIEQVGSYEYANFWNQKMRNDGVTDPSRLFSREAIEAYRTGSDPIMYPNVNWTKMMCNDVFLQSKNIISFASHNRL